MGEGRMTSVDRINLLNIGLMVASCAAAYALPFELFLFAYAVLGPLHYLTEISWIHDRRYFVDGERSAAGRHRMRVWLVLVGVTLAAMVYGVVAERLLHWQVSPALEIGLFYCVVVAAALAVFRANELVSAGAILLLGMGLIAFAGSPLYGLIAFLLLTIVHVLIFTGAFVLLGALRTRSLTGLVSVAVFAACALSFFLFAPGAADPGAWVHTNYAPFETLNAVLIRMFGYGTAADLAELYQSRGGVIVMRLIAFAYTYHYLNWFTKTSVIRWHQVSRRRAGVILLLWLGSLAVYAQSYLLGFALLYSLSALHVMLELPLNHQSFADIGRELAARFRPAAPVPARAPARGPSRAARRLRSRR